MDSMLVMELRFLFSLYFSGVDIPEFIRTQGLCGYEREERGRGRGKGKAHYLRRH
jgi:hypothetical protein